MKSFFKILLFIPILLSFIIILGNKNPIYATYCNDNFDCPDESPPFSCFGESVQCLDHVCSYTWNCTDACSSWTDWYPNPCASGQQTRTCINYPVLFQIQNCGGSSGGGAYQYPTCGSKILNCGSSPKVYLAGGGEETNDSNLAHCEFRGVCGDDYFPSFFSQTGCDGQETKGLCQINCGCCNAGEDYIKSITTGSNYTDEINCHSATRCRDWDDIYIQGSRVQGGGSGNCYCDCPPDNDECNNNTCERKGGTWIKNDLVTCTSATTTWSCVPSCTASSPSAPSLIYPSNGDTVSTTTNNLRWGTIGQTWGTGCPSNNNNYYLYVGTTSSNLSLVGSAAERSGVLSISITRSAGTYYWQVRASNGSLTANSPIWSFTITDAEPWWQVKDGDVTTTNDLSSKVPTGQLFDIIGLGGFAGVPVYGGTFNLSDETALISTSEWHANTATTQSRIFNYSFFDNLIPNDVNFNDISLLATGGTPYSDGYEWFFAEGDVSTSGDINIGNRKVILFIENGNFNINGKINVNDGNGFFGVFVGGDISIDSAVAGTPSIEGIYLSNNFSSGVGTSQLHVRGSVATFGTVNLQRDLTVDTTPAELFEFAPDQMLLFPEKLMFRRTKWTEVAP